MLLSQLRFAIRIFRKYRFFTVLNLLGLALGITVTIILLLILQHDLGYDKHFANHKNIYRVSCDYFIPGMEFKSALAARELGIVLKEKYPDVLDLTKVDLLNRALVNSDFGGKHQSFYEENMVRVDDRYFKIFNHVFIAGDAATCLTDPHAVVVTRAIASKYFGTVDVLNKIIQINGESLTISGVIENHPDNTHLKFDFLLSGLSEFRDWTMEKGKPISEAFWNPDVQLFIRVPDHFDPAAFYERFPETYAEYFKPIGDQVGGRYSIILQPLADIHFDSRMGGDKPHGNLMYLVAFTSIGLLIFLMACINYVNLTTAQFTRRSKEIALKRVVGSPKRTLIVSALVESVGLAFLALVLALGLIYLVLTSSAFKSLTGMNLVLDFFHNPILLSGTVTIPLVIGLLSGIYPGIYLSRIHVIPALKGATRGGRPNLVLRKVLITTQFTISFLVITSALLMRDQIDFVRTKDLGFNKENILVIPVHESTDKKKVHTLKQLLLKNPQVVNVTLSDYCLGLGVGNSVMFGESQTGWRQQGGIGILTVDDDFMETFDIPLLSGRTFKPGIDTEQEGVYIANESAIAAMQLGPDPLGKKIKFFHGQNPGQVIGVVKDFNSSALYEPTRPLLILKGNWATDFVYVRVRGNDLPGTIQTISKTWTGLAPDRPFEYFFLDERFNEQYKADEVQYRLLTQLAGVCVFIAALGLLGLSAFAAAQRTKEIGVRKVLGAGLSGLIFLLAREVLWLVVVSSALAIPLILWMDARWKENFAYKIQVNPGEFVLVTAISLLIVLIIIALQSLKVARMNPVRSLRYE